MTEPGLVDSPGWRRAQWVVAAIAVVSAATVMSLLTWSYVQVTSIESELRDANAWSDQFADITRFLGRLELAIVETGGTDDPAVAVAVAQLRRPVLLAENRIDRARDDQFVQDLVAVVGEADAITAAIDRGDAADEVRALVADAERRAKNAADRGESARRTQLRDQVDESAAIARLTAIIATVIVLVDGALLLFARRHFRSAYAEAYGIAVARAGALARTNEELVAANATKERFVSMVSHELRTPLTIIRGFGETLRTRGDRLAPVQHDELIDGIIRQSVRQERMINDLLTVALQSAQGVSAEPSLVEIGEVVRGLLADLGDELACTVHVTSTQCPAMADPRHVEQIVENLLTNAGKYGGPNVWVQCETAGDMVRIAISDDGHGVDPVFVSRMFEPFNQADVGDRRVSQGVGLGLTIARMLAEANGGSLSYDPAPDRVARFVLTLPLASAPAGGGDPPALAQQSGSQVQ